MTAEPIALVGATATGKTAAGLLLAEELGTEIIGCDSRQVYRTLAIGTAKPTPAERARVRHHLVDCAEPAERFSAARYRDAVAALLPVFAAAGRVPLFVGGTGLYLRAALAGLTPAPPSQPALRRWLAAIAGSVPGGLHPLLARVDAAAAARIHRNDRYRVTRALEIYYLSGRTWTEQMDPARVGRSPLRARLFLIDVESAELRRRIGLRLEQMMAAGFLEEVGRLFDAGLDQNLPALRAVGYPELFAHLRGETTLAAALERVRSATWQYARRQLTWFRAEPGVVRVPAVRTTSAEEIADAIIRSVRASRGAA